MTDQDRNALKSLSDRLRAEQSALLLAAARSGGLPSLSTLRRVSDIELNIAAIENTLAEHV